MQALKKVGENLWLHEDSLTIMPGARLRLRMTIVKLTDGGLWIHSPTALSPELKVAVDELGPVNFIIGPNNAHNLWLREWHDAYPEGVLHVSAKVPKKTGLENYQILDDCANNRWHKDLVHIYLSGVSLFDESIFLHLPTKSLLVTDFIQNHSDPRPPGFSGWISRLLLEPLGFKGICVAPPLKLGFVIQDKAAFASAIKTVQGWDFERIIVTHGDVIEKNAKQVFTELCQRFL